MNQGSYRLQPDPIRLNQGSENEKQWTQGLNGGVIDSNSGVTVWCYVAKVSNALPEEREALTLEVECIIDDRLWELEFNTGSCCPSS